jgi:TetR/AcrR family transcriptional repressor of mexJK operon
MPAIRTERYWMAGLEKPSRSRERRALILQTATDLFLEHGYAGTSTDAIVQRSSVSKQTVYAHFGSKEELFRAAIEAFSTFTTRAIDEQPLDPSEPVVSLRKIGTNILKALTARRSLALLRLIIAESGREPEVRETFLRYGPESSERTVADFLRKCARGGQLGDSGSRPLFENFYGSGDRTAALRRAPNETALAPSHRRANGSHSAALPQNVLQLRRSDGGRGQSRLGR